MMQFHHQGYVSGDPRIHAPAGVGVNRPRDIPDCVDVLIVGAGPAGMTVAAQLSAFPDIDTRIIDRRAGRLEVGNADGIQPRSLETFEAFGFAGRLIEEACTVMETAFWRPDPDAPDRIRRASVVAEDPYGVSEYPHVTANQARVLDYFAEVMARSPARMVPDYGVSFEALSVAETGEYPVMVRLSPPQGSRAGARRVIHARYVVGADGAHSRVRQSIGCRFTGHSSNRAWGVLDLLAVTDFPDVRRKCVIQSAADGDVLLIPREGGFLFRLYIDLGTVAPGQGEAIRATPAAATIARAQRILRPYTLDIRAVARYAVYEVGHRISDRFDDVPAAGYQARMPRVFIAGDAAHTHSAQAGQGMNVSIQDGFNLGWKLAHVLDGRAREPLLATYAAERSAIGRDIIRFDERWSTAMAKRVTEFDKPEDVEAAYLESTEFAQGFMTRYAPSLITAEPTFQRLAPGFPIGKRFRSAPVRRVADGARLHLGHEAAADGRWRLYVFAGQAPAGSDAEPPEIRFARHAASWPAVLHLPPRASAAGRFRAWVDTSLVYQRPYTEIDLGRVPPLYLPPVAPYGVTDYSRVYAACADNDIFELRQVDRQGVAILVRPDQYVSHIVPLSSPDALMNFLERIVPADVSPRV